MLAQNEFEETRRQYDFINQCREYVNKKSEAMGRPLSACIVTFGCQMNARDSEKLAGILGEMGYVITDSEDADFVIYNTCTVRENANLKVYGRLGHLKSIKQKRPGMIIALCGCMMQEEAVVEKIKQSHKHVDIVFGTHNIYKLAELLKAHIESGSMIIDIWKDTDRIVEDLPVERKYAFKTGINIMFGCNNFCSYCIVPYVRGRERSRNAEDIIREIKQAVSEGVLEVMLLGQNVNSYGKDLANPKTFANLLTEIEKIDGLKRIRFMTSHPKDLSDELIEVMGNSKKISRHLHLPLQSGSSRILTAMNRHYTKEDFLILADKIKVACPDISLTTDIIVGFPGETNEDFLETLDVVQKVGFSSAYTFIYSKRTGTPAATMTKQVPEDVIKERFSRLLEVVQHEASLLAKQQVGSIQEVLVEEVNTHDDQMMTGRLSNNLIVHFSGRKDLIGQIIQVNLLECKGFYYIGEQIQP